MSKLLASKHIRLVNSGSSANLVALSSLTGSKIKNKIEEGDHVLTAVVGFSDNGESNISKQPNTVFIDCELGTYNPKAEDIINAYTSRNKSHFLSPYFRQSFGNGKISRFC